MSGTADATEATGVARSVAVVGSGPSGLYAAASIARGDDQVCVDVIDRLASPYGLVRYGVAPDHATIKTVTRVLAKPFDNPRVRFLGNVEVGRDVDHEELVGAYDAVVYATGSQLDRPLGVPGEELAGSMGSARLVGWYSGHPDVQAVALDMAQVVVVGGGNVALDVARVLGRPAGDFRATDVPDQVLAALEASQVTDVHVLVRRGPADAKFTHLELLSLEELGGLDLVVHDDVRAPVPQDLSDSAEGDRVRRNVELFARWQDASPTGAPRRVHVHFRRQVESLVSSTGPGGRVDSVLTAATSGSALPPASIAAGLVVRAIGYDSAPLRGLPFDHSRGLVPNEGGRVVSAGVVVPGVYVTGWCKRGSTGVIATNKACAAETAGAVLADLAELPAPRGGAISVTGAVDWPGWGRLDDYERASGALRGAERVKDPDHVHMVAVARGETVRA